MARPPRNFRDFAGDGAKSQIMEANRELIEVLKQLENGAGISPDRQH
jgi:hypothetical protein